MKNQRFTTSGCNDLGGRKFIFVMNVQLRLGPGPWDLLLQLLDFFSPGLSISWVQDLVHAPNRTWHYWFVERDLILISSECIFIHQLLSNWCWETSVELVSLVNCLLVDISSGCWTSSTYSSCLLQKGFFAEVASFRFIKWFLES